MWVSSVFSAFGELTPLGARFFAHCQAAAPKRKRLIDHPKGKEALRVEKEPARRGAAPP